MIKSRRKDFRQRFGGRDKQAEQRADVSSFIRKNGFIWGPEPEIYGGVAGFYSYGPLGKLLKDKVENAIRKVFKTNGYWEIEAPIIMPKEVWHASGHLTGFVDKIVRCKNCKAIFRVDRLIEEQTGIDASTFTKKKLLSTISKKDIRCPKCKGHFTHEIEDYNLMMKTHIEFDREAYNRPETATTTYLPFKNYYEFFRKTLPFRVFQIGKAFRNEVSPRQNVIRGREFTQAEAQLFIKKSEKNSFPEYEKVRNTKLPLWSSADQKNKKWRPISLESARKKKFFKSKVFGWCLWVAYKFFEEIGIPKDKMRFRQHSPEELAHYAEDAWDLEINLNTYGWIEMVGVHDRGDYDLKQHSKYSHENLAVEGEHPNILEVAFGSDRPTFALVDLFLEQEKERIVLKIPQQMAPVTAAVFPLVSKDKLPILAKKVFEDLKKAGLDVIYDEAGSIGKRYRRQDERGTPFCITIDYDSLKKKDVTVRNRDSMKQKRIKISKLVDYIKKSV